MARQDLNAVFPRPELEHSWEAPGLTKREYFAAMAMQGILSNDALLQRLSENPILDVECFALRQADALLARLEADNEPNP